MKNEMTLQECKSETAKKYGLGSTLVTGHKSAYWEEAAELYAASQTEQLRKENASLRKQLAERERESKENFKAWLTCIDQRDKLREALDEIANPLKYIQARAEKEGNQLNGYMASELSRSHSYLKGIAEKVLQDVEPSPSQEQQKPFADFSDAFFRFLAQNCVPASLEFDAHEPPYIECDIHIHLNSSGGGYIHLINQDSDTIDFRTMDHYQSTNTPKPKHLQ